jgi:CheY-like chemotaxis protein
MARLLLIDPDRGRATRVAAALGAAGHEVSVATSGSYALTMLERGRPDLVVTRAEAGDMTGAELTAVVRADPATRTIPLLLLDEGGVAADVADVDLVLDGESRVSAVLTGIETVLSEQRRRPGARRGPRPSVAKGLRGSLAVMDLPEVAQAIALGTKTGRLGLTLPMGPGTIVFEAGRIIHVEYGQLTGEPAFAALIGAARTGGDFSFTAMERDALRGVPRTIHGSVERLLIMTASDIDEGRVVTAGSTRAEGR